MPQLPKSNINTIKAQQHETPKKIQFIDRIQLNQKYNTNSMLKLEQTCLFIINFLLQPTTAF